jgi:hypothetical protein
MKCCECIPRHFCKYFYSNKSINYKNKSFIALSHERNSTESVLTSIERGGRGGWREREREREGEGGGEEKG